MEVVRPLKSNTEVHAGLGSLTCMAAKTPLDHAQESTEPAKDAPNPTAFQLALRVRQCCDTKENGPQLAGR